MTNEQIKKLIEVCEPEGFSFENGALVYTCDSGQIRTPVELLANGNQNYKCFLQSCIEGVNKQSRENPGKTWQFFTIESDVVEWHDMNKPNKQFWIEEFETIDQAKEALLLWYLEEIRNLMEGEQDG